MIFETERLVVRNWHDEDLDDLAAIKSDPVAMRHFPSLKTREECAVRLARWKVLGEADGATLAPIVRKGADRLIGFVGILPITNEGLPNHGGYELAWTIAPAYWRRGYASEAARGWIAHAFGTLRLGRLVAFTTPANVASQAVMRSIGMVRIPGGDFDHPEVTEGPLCRHVLYEITRS